MPEPPTDPSLVVRTAVRVGEALGHWRRQRATAAQDAFIERWKAAWSEGYHAGFQGVSSDTVPYRIGPQRDAWSAGWHWASTHADRHNSNGSTTARERRPVPHVRRSVIGAAGGGAVGVAFLAAARWLWRSRRQP